MTPAFPARGPAERKRVDDDRGAGDGAAGREVGALVERDSRLGAREPGGDGFGFGFTRGGGGGQRRRLARSEEHTSGPQALMRITYAVFCLKTKISIRDKLHDTHTEQKEHNQ